MRTVKLCFCALTLTLGTACGPAALNPGGDASAGLDGGTPADAASLDGPAGDAASPDAGPVAPRRAIITSRDLSNMGGAINLVDLKTHAVQAGLDTTIDADTSVRVLPGGRALLLNKLKGTLRLYDTAKWAVLAEARLEDKDHPAASAFALDAVPIGTGSTVLVSLSGNDSAHALGVVDLAAPRDGITKWITVPTAAADKDGKPEAASIYACGALHYVVLDDYDSAGTFAPTGPGRIAVVDAAAGTVTKVIQLQFENPAQLARTGADCHSVIAISPGPYGIEPGARSGVERVDLAAGTAGARLFDGVALKGVPRAAAIASDQVGYLLLDYDLQEVMGQGYKILARGRLVSFNPTTGANLADASPPAGYIPFVAVSGDGQVWFGTDNLANVNSMGNLKTGLYVGSADGKNGPYKEIDVMQRPTFAAFE